MDRNIKIYGGTLATITILYIAKSTFSNPALNDLFVLSALLGGIGLAGKLVQEKKLASRLKSYSRNKKKGGGANYTTDECKEIAKEWAKNNFHGKISSKKGVSFDWTQSSTEPAQVYDFRNEEWLDIRYFYTPHGPRNRAVFIFVDATNGQHYATESVIPHKMKDNPFNYLESYRQTKRFASRIKRGDEEGSGQSIQALTGIPVDQSFQPGSSGEG